MTSRVSIDHHVTNGVDAGQKRQYAEQCEADARHHDFMAHWLENDAYNSGDYSDVKRQQALAEQARSEAAAARHGFLSWLFG